MSFARAALPPSIFTTRQDVEEKRQALEKRSASPRRFKITKPISYASTATHVPSAAPWMEVGRPIHPLPTTSAMFHDVKHEMASELREKKSSARGRPPSNIPSGRTRSRDPAYISPSRPLRDRSSSFNSPQGGSGEAAKRRTVAQILNESKDDITAEMARMRDENRRMAAELEQLRVENAELKAQKPRRDDDDNPPSEALHQRVADLEAMLHALKGELAETKAEAKAEATAPSSTNDETILPPPSTVGATLDDLLRSEEEEVGDGGSEAASAPVVQQQQPPQMLQRRSSLDATLDVGMVDTITDAQRVSSEQVSRHGTEESVVVEPEPAALALC